MPRSKYWERCASVIEFILARFLSTIAVPLLGRRETSAEALEIAICLECMIDTERVKPL
jgi:hypothetical protein